MIQRTRVQDHKKASGGGSEDISKSDRSSIFPSIDDKVFSGCGLRKSTHSDLKTNVIVFPPSAFILIAIELIGLPSAIVNTHVYV
jgi:hypothetical protein